MFDTIEELLTKIRLGEDTTMEFKAVRFKGNKPDLSRGSIADEIAAMANTTDGVIIFGVDDKTRTISGVPLDKLDSLVDLLTELVNDVIKPSVSVRIVRLELPSALGTAVPVVKMDIPRSLFVHKSPGGYFYRQGDKKREMSPEMLARLFQQRSQVRLIRFDEQAVPLTSINDLDELLWRRFSGGTDEAPEVMLEKLKLLVRDDQNAYRLTVSGVLLATRKQDVILPNAVIEAVAYRGKERDSNYQENARTLSGPLDEQVRQALSFVKQNMKITALKDPGRTELPQYSLRAVFEALVNAVAHRDYSVFGSKIRLFLFDDRLELYSPGAIPNSMTIDSMALRQSTRNELIASLLNRCSVDKDQPDLGRQFMMDKRGEGVPIIMKESLTLSGMRPVYRLIDDAELLLTIYAASIER